MAYIVDFGDYKYIGQKRGMQDNMSYAFNPDWYSTLVATRRYQDAYDYASQYEFKDPDEQDDYKSRLKTLQSKARILNSIYSKVPQGSDDDQAISFRDNLFQPGGLSYLKDNTYAQRFQQYKDMLGGVDTSASKIGIHFDNEKQYGWFNIDALSADNKLNIDNFCKISGYSLDELKNIQGIEVKQDDHGYEIVFDKEDKESNKLLYGLYKLHKEFGGTPNIKGYDDDNQEIKLTDNHPIMNWLPGGRQMQSSENTRALMGMFNLFEDADARKDELLANTKLDKVTTSTMLCGFIADGLEHQYKRMLRGEIDVTTYNAIKSHLQDSYDAQIRGLGASQYQMYTNLYNSDGTATLNEVTTEQRSELMNEISKAIKSNRVSYQAAQSGGRLGTMITVDATDGTKSDDNDDVQRFSVFVPGLWTEKAQKRINANSTFRAAQEIGNMELYGYDFKLNNGKEIRTITGLGDPNAEGASLTRHFALYDPVSKTTTDLDREQAAKYIDQSMIMEDGLDNILRSHRNVNGELINMDSVRDEIKELATEAVNNLYDDVIPLPLNAIFSNEVVTDENGNIILDNKGNVQIKDKNIQYQLYNKIQEAYNIYDYILRNIIRRR